MTDSVPAAQAVTLATLLGTYDTTRALKEGRIASDALRLDFADVTPVTKGFAPMVREGRYDIAELAIVTLLMARAHGKPLVMLPAVAFGRFQHGALVYDRERGKLTPDRLEGRRIGIRSYAQTTGAWIRGILADDYGVDTGRIRWVCFEGAHVAEFPDPENAERAAPGKILADMLFAGEVDAAIFGADMPGDARIAPVIPDPEAAARDWFARTGAVPVNHVVTARASLSQERPELVREFYRMLVESKQQAPSTGEIDTAPFGLEANRAGLDLAIDYAFRQGLIPRRIRPEDLFDDTTLALAS